jgi:hypothetical protein
MRRFLVVAAASALTVLGARSALAQDRDTSTKEQDESSKPAAPSALPLSDVVLYSSGVGYFQRDGDVQGKAQVDLRFKVDNINDLLKSMVVQDFDGGRISAVTYGSRDPVTKTLKSFGIDLTENPTLGELLDQVRGERVEIATPNPVIGTILGVETKEQPAGENKVASVEYLNIFTDEGLRSIPMSQVGRIRLLNQQLNTELNQALAVLAASHDTQKKTVSLTFDGDGKRKVSVSYIMETPVWKTSYRLVLDDEGKPFLQGWAIVENTTDDDWSNVKLSLISGRPISFIMDMYQPLYVQRPVIVPELYASLRPQVYGEAMESERKLAEERQADARSRVAAKAAAPAPAPAGAAGFGMGGGMGGAPARRGAVRAENMAADALAVEGLARQQLQLQQGVASAAQSAQTGELFEYSIKTPVTLARQKSAMLPIVSEDVDGSKVSIYNQTVHAKFPLNGYRLKNTSELNLMQGPITVFDGGTYAGDARIEDIAPGQERLISYAMDLKVEVEPIANVHSPELTSVRVRKGTLISTRKAVEEKTYNLKNRDQKKKVVLVEHPFREGWELKEPSEPTERTREVYRLTVALDAEKGGRVHVREERPIQEQVQLTDSGPDVIAYFLKAEKVSQKVKDALGRVVELRNKVSQTAAERGRKEQRINEITQEQARVRENMKVLNQTSEVYKNYEKEFVQQDTDIKNIRKEIESIRATEAKQQKELNDYLLSLDVE